MVSPLEHSSTSSYSSENVAEKMKYCDDYDNENDENGIYDANSSNNQNVNTENNNNCNNDSNNKINSRTKCLMGTLQRMQISHKMTEAEKNEKYTSAVLWASNLNEMDCILLLKLYLTSLSARDCSILISMERVTSVSKFPLSTLKSSSSASSSNINMCGAESIISPFPISHSSEYSYSSSSSASSPSPEEWSTLCVQSSLTAGIVCKSRISSGNSNSNWRNESNFVGVDATNRCNEDDGEDDDQIQKDEEVTFIAYTIGIVDIGQKPISKIESKMILEDQICSIALLGKSINSGIL